VTFSLVGSIVGFVVLVLSSIGLPGLFALMAVESFGIPPLPSEVILPFAGFLVVQGTLSFGSTIAVAVAGGLAGSFAAYAVGRWGRHLLVDLGVGPIRLEASHLERMDRFFQRRGEVTVGLARLAPVIRSYISYPAGTARMSPTRFGIYTVLGSIPFTVAFVYAGMLLGERWNELSGYLRWFDYAAAVVVVLAVAYLALLALGWITPGWPPRWVPRAARSADATRRAG
jgi:membrane protein DedA with SNARE-associated domain